MLDRIDFIPDMPDGMRLMPMMLDAGTLIRTPQRRSLQYMFEGVNGIRMDFKRNTMQDLNSSMNDPEPDPDDIDQYYVSRVIVNPWKFSSLYALRDTFNRLFWRCVPQPEYSERRWPFRIQRIEIAVDMPIEPEHGQSGFATTRSQVRHYQNQVGTRVRETVYGNPPARLAIYDRRTALRRIGEPVPAHPLTRFECRYTKPSSWNEPSYQPNKEIQSIDWLINMCADIEEGIFQPFEGMGLRDFRALETTEDLQRLRRQVLRAELRKPARTQALNDYTERHAEFVAITMMARRYGYMETLQHIINTYGRGHAQPYRTAVDRRCREILEAMFPINPETSFGEALKASIRNHHFEGAAPRRVEIEEVPPRPWSTR